MRIRAWLVVLSLVGCPWLAIADVQADGAVETADSVSARAAGDVAIGAEDSAAGSPAQAGDTSTGDVAAQVKRGDAERAQGLNDDAMRSYEAVLGKYPGQQGTGAELEAAIERARAGEVEAAIALALQARGAGDTDGALVYLARARKYVPDDPVLLLDFGLQADSMHIYRDADEALRASLRLRPGDAQTLYALARVEMDEQKMPEAEAHLRAYLKQKPEDASAHYGLGKLLHMLVRDDEARAELKRSIELKPLQTESYYELGTIDLEQAENDSAEAEFRRVLARAANHGGALTGMGTIAYRRKDYAQAETYLRAAVLNAPEYAPAHRYYGMALERLGKHDQAAEQMAEAKSLEAKQAQESRGYQLKVP